MTPAIHAALELHPPSTAKLPQFPTDAELAAERELNKTRASILDHSWPAKVAAFRSLYSLARHDNALPDRLCAARELLHRRLLQEEFDETLLAITYPEQVDGLLDLIYVAIGWLLESGLTPRQVNALMEDVHASNLTKVGDDGKPIYDPEGKVLKGPQHIKAQPELLLQQFTEAALIKERSNAQHD